MYGIHVSSGDLEKNPKFAELLTQLERKVTPQGISLNLQKNLDQTRHNFCQARNAWRINHILHNEVSELLGDLEVKNQDGNISLSEKQLQDVLTIALAHSELEHYLHYQSDPNSRSTLFNLSSRDIAQHNPAAKHIQTVQQTALLPLVEERLMHKCEALYNFYHNEKDHCSEQLLIKKSQSLPAVIEQRVQKLKESKKTLDLNHHNTVKQFWSYYQKLLEGISLMKEMLKTHKLKTQFETDRVNIGWLKALCDVFCQKLQLIQMQILCKTYDRETQKALSNICSSLDTALQQIENELSATQHTLNGYHAIGGEFKSLVSEFTQMQAEIDNRQWALNQLGRWGASGEKGAEGGAANLLENDKLQGEKTSNLLETKKKGISGD